LVWADKIVVVLIVVIETTLVGIHIDSIVRRRLSRRPVIVVAVERHNYKL
jgi:hypothetical protein